MISNAVVVEIQSCLFLLNINFKTFFVLKSSQHKSIKNNPKAFKR